MSDNEPNFETPDDDVEGHVKHRAIDDDGEGQS